MIHTNVRGMRARRLLITHGVLDPGPSTKVIYGRRVVTAGDRTLRLRPINSRSRQTIVGYHRKYVHNESTLGE